jgi:hypothetical protein
MFIRFKGRDAYSPEKRPELVWKSIDNQREFFDSLAVKLNIISHDGWYNVGKKEIHANGGMSATVSKRKPVRTFF